MPHVEIPQAEFKVVLLGDTNTGKTCLVLRFAEGYYRERSSTIGAFFLTKRLTVKNLTCKMLIWDTAGQSQYQRLAQTYYQSAAAAILCFDVGNPHSLLRVRQWIQELNDKLKTPIVLTICACKCDLEAVQGLEDEAKTLAESLNAQYFSTSAKSDTNVASLFEATAERVLTWQEEAERGQRQALPITVGKSTPRSVSAPVHRPPDNLLFVKSEDTLKPELDQDTVTDSDDIEEEPPKVMCEGGLLSCGTADPTKSCVIL